MIAIFLACGLSYDATESAHWGESGSKSAGLTVWKQNTQYDTDEVVVYNDSFYISSTYIR